MTMTADQAKRVPDTPKTSLAKKRGRGRPVGDRDAKRGELLAAGLSVIAELGYAGASLRKVADRAGYTTGAVTYYFANKEEMVVALTEYLFDEFDALLSPANQILDVKQAFQLLFERVRIDADLWLAQFQLLAFARVEPACAAVFARRYSAYRNGLAHVISVQQDLGAIRRDISADLLADQLSAMGDGWMMLLPVEPERFEAQHVEVLLDSVMTLLAPR